MGKEEFNDYMQIQRTCLKQAGAIKEENGHTVPAENYFEVSQKFRASYTPGVDAQEMLTRIRKGSN